MAVNFNWFVLHLGGFKHFTNLTCKNKTLCHFTDGKTEISDFPVTLSRAAAGLRAGLRHSSDLCSSCVASPQHTPVLYQCSFHHPHTHTASALLRCSQRPLHRRLPAITSEESGHLDAN